MSNKTIQSTQPGFLGRFSEFRSENDTDPAKEGLKKIYAKILNAIQTQEGLPWYHAVNGALIESYEQAISGQDPSPPLECKKGCDFCCHLPVAINAPEAFSLAAIIDQQPDAVRTRFLTAIRTAEKKARGFSVGARWAAKIPCVFLAPDGACQIYSARPYGCRTHHSTSAKACEDDGKPKIRADFAVKATSNLEAFMNACRERGLATEFYEMNKALRIVLDRGTMRAARAWLSGKDVLKDAICVVSARSANRPAGEDA